MHQKGVEMAILGFLLPSLCRWVPGSSKKQRYKLLGKIKTFCVCKWPSWICLYLWKQCTSGVPTAGIWHNLLSTLPISLVFLYLSSDTYMYITHDILYVVAIQIFKCVCVCLCVSVQLANALLALTSLRSLGKWKYLGGAFLVITMTGDGPQWYQGCKIFSTVQDRCPQQGTGLPKMRVASPLKNIVHFQYGRTLNNSVNIRDGL